MASLSQTTEVRTYLQRLMTGYVRRSPMDDGNSKGNGERVVTVA